MGAQGCRVRDLDQPHEHKTRLSRMKEMWQDLGQLHEVMLHVEVKWDFKSTAEVQG